MGGGKVYKVRKIWTYERYWWQRYTGCIGDMGGMEGMGVMGVMGGREVSGVREVCEV